MFEISHTLVNLFLKWEYNNSYCMLLTVFRKGDQDLFKGARFSPQRSALIIHVSYYQVSSLVYSLQPNMLKKIAGKLSLT